LSRPAEQSNVVWLTSIDEGEIPQSESVVVRKAGHVGRVRAAAWRRMRPADIIDSLVLHYYYNNVVEIGTCWSGGCADERYLSR